MSIQRRVERLEAIAGASKPPCFIWAALFTEVTPGVFRFDLPEEMRGKTVTRQEIEEMHIPMILVDFLNGKTKGRVQ